MRMKGEKNVNLRARLQSARHKKFALLVTEVKSSNGLRRKCPTSEFRPFGPLIVFFDELLTLSFGLLGKFGFKRGLLLGQQCAQFFDGGDKLLKVGLAADGGTEFLNSADLHAVLSCMI